MGEPATNRTALLSFASADLPGEGGKALEHRFAGERVIDRQLGLLGESGHSRIIIHADPADGVARRLWNERRGGALDLIFATSGGDVVAALEGVEQLTLVAHGTLWQPELMTAVLEHGPLIATHFSAAPRPGFERIDADANWSGLALLPGQMARDTARTLGEWDLQSTLLRKAVQAGMPRMPAPPELVGSASEKADVERFVALRFASAGTPDDQILTPPARGLFSALPRVIAERIDNAKLWLAAAAGALGASALGLAYFLPGLWAYAPILFAAPLISVRQVLVRITGKTPWLGAAAIYAGLALVSAVLGLKALLPDARAAAMFTLAMASATTALAALFSSEKPGLPAWWRIETMIIALIALGALVGLVRGWALFSVINLVAIFAGGEARARMARLIKS